MSIHNLLLLAFAFLAAPESMPVTTSCAPMTEQIRAKVSAYVADEYQIAPDLSVIDEGPVLGTCFRRITIRSVAPARSPLHLVLSPDQRFLSETLLDTTVRPSVERARVARETNRALAVDKSPAIGRPSASVTLVEFSDFQCPFCKRFESVLNGLPDDDRRSIRIIFKHRPLDMHKWARRAASYSICASQQNAAAFWKFKTWLFDHQTSLTIEDLDHNVGNFVGESSEIDLKRLVACVETGGADAVLARDERIANLYRVDAVPTLFINGVRTVGTGSVEELKALLAKAQAASEIEMVLRP